MALFENPDGLTVARELIPAKVRRGIYAAASLVGYALGAVVVGYATLGTEALPEFVPVALAVLGALMGPLGQLAATNTPSAAAVAVAAPQAAVEVAVGDDEPEPAPEVDPDDLIVQRAAFGDGGGDV
jgi:hypothetical protein